MKKALKRKLVVLLFLIVIITSCKEEQELILPDFTHTSQGNTEIDAWIRQNYTSPYNITVQYHWDPFEVPINKILVPVKEDKVVPAMRVVKQIWVDPYVKVAGDIFFKQRSPKQFVLVGSAQYNNDGTIVLGEAEGGRKITLFIINSFDKKNVPAVKGMLHTIHHEFAHILHQTILYPREYKLVTPSGYTATWYNTTTQSSLDLGFITPYARASFDEDFVEMIATMLIEGDKGFENIMKTASPEGQSLLRRKQSMVKAYFKSSWNIDFDALQKETEKALIEATM